MIEPEKGNREQKGTLIEAAMRRMEDSVEGIVSLMSKIEGTPRPLQPKQEIAKTPGRALAELLTQLPAQIDGARETLESARSKIDEMLF